MKKPKINLAGFTGVVESAMNTGADPDSRMVPVALIDVEEQVRTTFEELDDLAQNIEKNGLLQPILLKQKSDGRYLLIAGERRLRVFRQLGRETIPARLKDGALSEVGFRAAQVSENKARKDLNPFDEALGVIRDVDKFGLEAARAIWGQTAADEAGDGDGPDGSLKSRGWISKRLAVKDYAEPVLQLLRDGHSGDFEVLGSLQQLFELNKGEFELLAARLRESGSLSRDVVRAKVSMVKEHKRAQEARAKAEKAAKKAMKASPSPIEPGEADAPAAVESAATAAAVTKGKKSEKASPALPSPSAPVQLDDKSVEAISEIFDQRGMVFFAGESLAERFVRMKADTVSAGLSMAEADWVLWCSFLSGVLPVLDAVGSARAGVFVKRLQAEIKTKTAAELWESLHPAVDGGARDVSPAMPDGWTL
jgi:ParB family chromosome partitioning protein